MDALSFAYDFFLSRRGSVAAVAQEVADVLEAEGYRVRVQDYDFAAGGQFVAAIDDALKQARDLLILYSRDYHGSFWTRQEFHNFLAAVAAANGTRRIGLLRCDDDNPSGLLSSATYGDLHGVTDPAERRRIILAVARGEAPSARPTPRIFGGAMPPENRLFTGREAELHALHAALSSGTGRAALTQAAVHGLGGVGKTSLARAYVARFGHEYGGVWWITATDRLAIQTGLLELARALDPALPADARLERRGGQGARHAGGAARGNTVPAGLRQRALARIAGRAGAAARRRRAGDLARARLERGGAGSVRGHAAAGRRGRFPAPPRRAPGRGRRPPAGAGARLPAAGAGPCRGLRAARRDRLRRLRTTRGGTHPGRAAARRGLSAQRRRHLRAGDRGSGARGAGSGDPARPVRLVRAGGDSAGAGGREGDAGGGARGRGDGAARGVAADAGTGRGVRAGGLGASVGAGGDAGAGWRSARGRKRRAPAHWRPWTAPSLAAPTETPQIGRAAAS